LVGVLQLDFVSEIRDFCHFGGHNSFSRSACERPPNVTFNVSWGLLTWIRQPMGFDFPKI